MTFTVFDAAGDVVGTVDVDTSVKQMGFTVGDKFRQRKIGIINLFHCAHPFKINPMCDSVPFSLSL